MAFPDIPTVGAGRVLTAVQANTTAARTFPNLSSLTKNAGDLLLAFVAAYQSSTLAASFSSWGASFTEFFDTAGGSSTILLGGAYKVSDGTETGTFTVTQNTTITGHAAMLLMSIPNAHRTVPPEAGTVVFGTTSAANPASLSPSWGTDDTLWISLAGIGETSTGGTFTGLATSPTNYSGDVLSSISADAVGGVQIGVGFRQLNTASEDIGTWSLDTSNARNAAVAIAVRSQPPLQLPFVVMPQYFGWL